MHGLGHLNLRVVTCYGFSAAQATTSPRSGQSSFGSFLNQSSLKLGQRREYVEDKFSRGGRGVNDAIANRTESDASLFEFLHKGH